MSSYFPIGGHSEQKYENVHKVQTVRKFDSKNAKQMEPQQKCHLPFGMEVGVIKRKLKLTTDGFVYKFL